MKKGTNIRVDSPENQTNGIIVLQQTPEPKYQTNRKDALYDKQAIDNIYNLLNYCYQFKGYKDVKLQLSAC